jgi:hypothetical protein
MTFLSDSFARVSRASGKNQDKNAMEIILTENVKKSRLNII